MNLATFWFILIAILWSGYFVLEGFDFGVGILLPLLGRDDAERRVMINTIGPVWDGNEVWLLTAGRRDVRRLPALVRLPVQRLLPPAAAHPGGADRPRRLLRVPRQGGQRALAGQLGPGHLRLVLLPALLWGVAFANIVHGVPMNAHTSTPATC